MSLEYALEKFPIQVTLRDGTRTVVRPMNRRDEARCYRFFTSVPELERLFIKQPIRDRSLLHEWCRQLDYERNLPLLMLHGSKVIGEVTLHQRLGGWKRHVGLLTFLTHPDYRGRDVAKALVEEAVQIARHLGLKKVEAELNGERKVAIKALEQLGFRQLMRLPDYVWDMEGEAHDYVFMGMDLLTEEEFASVGWPGGSEPGCPLWRAQRWRAELYEADVAMRLTMSDSRSSSLRIAHCGARSAGGPSYTRPTWNSPVIWV